LADWTAFGLIPEYRDYVWGGDRLRPGYAPTAEAWVVYEKDRIADGPLAGMSLEEAAAAHPQAILGRTPVENTGRRFPLLIKLLDCADWLSLQVHPDDEQAARLEGPGMFGKTEAWHILEAERGAQLIAGVRPRVSRTELDAAIRDGRALLDIVRYVDAQPGSTIFMQPGTIHALGPGLLNYEVQQTSDLTYRVWDWDRPLKPNRKLHIEKSLEVVDLNAAAEPVPPPIWGDGTAHVLVRCPYFTLEQITAETQALSLDTRGESFHALTVVEGAARVVTGGEVRELERFESVVVPAAAGGYRIEPRGRMKVMKVLVGAPS